MARITVTEPAIRVGEEGFAAHDVLGRAKQGKALSNIVESVDEPLVIAVDGQWGSGKSFFLRCWTGAHKLENNGNANVVYFDAFESDYIADPLIALVATIERYLPATPAQKSALSTIKGAAAKLWRPAARIALAAGTAGGTEVVGVIGDAVLDAARNEIADKLDERAAEVWVEAEAQRRAMSRFREGLEKLTHPEDGGETRKLVLVIDELDRCRPDYALSLLEIAKHFFAVPDVHFVLGVNLAELQNSVRARYGHAVDAERYLQKFITLKILLSDRGVGSSDTLANIYLGEAAKNLGLQGRTLEDLRQYLALPALRSTVTLRDVDRIISQLALVKASGTGVENVIFGFRVGLVGSLILRAMRSDLYMKARAGTLSFDEAKDFLIGPGPVGEDRNRRTQEHVWLGLLAPPDHLADEPKDLLFDGRPLIRNETLRDCIEEYIESSAIFLSTN